MANELIVRNGIIIQGSSTITTNEIVSGSMTILGATLFTASYAKYAETASYVNPSSITNILSGSGVVSSSAQIVSGINGQDITPGTVTASFKGDLVGTASYATNASSADTAVSASHALIADNATSASYATNALTASYVLGLNGHTASWALNAVNAINAQTASYVDYGSIVGITSTSQFVGTASYALGADTAATSVSASHALVADSADSVAYTNVTGITSTSTFAGTASFATKAGTADTATSASYASNASTADSALVAETASYVTWGNVDGKPNNLISSSAQFGPSDIFNVGQITASAILVENLSVVNITSSVIFSSGSNIFGNSLTNTQKMTGSVEITGSLTVNGPITGTITTASYAVYAANAGTAVSASNVQGSVTAMNPLGISNGVITQTISVFEVSGIVSALTIDSFGDTDGYGVKWLASARSVAGDYRISEILAAWDATGNLVALTEISTVDIGDTSALSYNVSINGSNQVELIATPTAGNWTVRGTRILI